MLNSFHWGKTIRSNSFSKEILNIEVNCEKTFEVWKPFLGIHLPLWPQLLVAVLAEPSYVAPTTQSVVSFRGDQMSPLDFLS